MSEDKKVEAKLEGVEVSGYMPPDMGPVSPYPPGFGPGGGPGYGPGYGPGCDHPCPPDHHPCPTPMMMDTLAHELKKLVGQQVTAYIMGLGPIGFTGILKEVGSNYVKHSIIVNGTERVMYIPFHALAYVVPGGALEPEAPPYIPETTL